MHDKHLNYRTINTAKSAISTFAVSQEKNTPIGNSELFKRFMKGLCVKPTSPQIHGDLGCKNSLDYLSSLENVNKLNLKMLTLKLTMLLCLVTAQRSQTLLRLSNIISERQNFIFTISDLVKQSSVRIIIIINNIP